jgi:hypothetical protein
MIPISEVIEACALEADKWATPEQIKHANGGPGAAIRALSAQYKDDIVAEGRHVAVQLSPGVRTPLYRAKETK